MKLTDDQQDALTEIVNIGVGKAGCMLSELVEERIELRVPSVQICSLEELPGLFGDRSQLLDTAIYQDFDGSVTGRSILAFPRESGLKLAQLLGELDEIPDELDVDLSGILIEVGNIVINGVLGSISNMFDSAFKYSVPELFVGDSLTRLTGECTDVESDGTQAVIYSNAHFSIAGNEIEGSLLLIFRLHEVERALNSLMQAV